MENPTCQPGPSKGDDPVGEWTQTREEYDFQFGQPRGDLSLVLDLLGDMTILLGQHGVYCRSRGTDPSKRIPPDLARIQAQLEAARHLVRGLLAQARNPGSGG